MKHLRVLAPRFTAVDTIAILAIFLSCFATLPYHDGINLYDPAWYVLTAKRFVHGEPIDFTSSIFVTRIGTWLPQAGYISLFGINECITWVTTLELCFFLCTLYWYLRRQDQAIALMSVVLIGFLHQVLTESSTCLGDIFLMGLLNLCALKAWFAEGSSLNRSQSMRQGVITGLLWVVAFYTKESAVLFLPFFVYLTWKARQTKSGMTYFWKSFWIVTFVAGIVTITYSAIVFNDPLWKLHGTEFAIVDANKDYGTSTAIGILKRWSLWWAEMFAQNYGFGLLSMLAAPFLVFNRNPALSFWRKYALWILLAWVFGTQRISDYSPIGLLPRLWLPILPVLAIAAAHTVASLARHQETVRDIATIVVFGILWMALDYITANNAQAAGKDTTWIWSAFQTYLFIMVCIITICIVPPIKDLLPNIRPLALWIIMFPSCYGAINESARFFSGPHRKSTYDYGCEASQYLKSLKPAHVLASLVYATNYEIFDISNLPVTAYGADTDIVPSSTYLLLNKDQIAYEKNGGRETQFTTKVVSLKPLEISPGRFGFKKVWENKIYEIWKN